jgi:hypothetical protein
MLLFDFSRPYHYYVPMFVDCMPSSRLSISLLRYSPNPNLKFVSFNRCILLFDPFMWESKSKSSAMVHHGFAWTIGYPGLELQVGLRATRRVLGRFIGSWSPLLKMPWMWHPSSIYPDLCRNLLLVATMACGYHPGSHIIMMLGFMCVYIYIYLFTCMRCTWYLIPSLAFKLTRDHWLQIPAGSANRSGLAALPHPDSGHGSGGWLDDPTEGIAPPR